MRAIVMVTSLFGALVSVTVEAQACSARGRYCNYPSWAANAFEDAQGRTPVSDVRPANLPKKLSRR